ncbi:MAG: RecX family transcriptional regulator [Flavobacteriia bacterium]|nr:RecX family transcriptional regulator [Flavobacteriia bacterium]
MQDSGKVYDLDKAREVIRKFCAYQERSQKQVRQRLQKMGLIEEAVDLLISECIQDNFLNEERFAKAFVRGKHSIKGWGRKRLERELKMNEVSEYCIRKAIEQLDDEAYSEKLEDLARKKWLQTKEPNRFKRGKKVVDHLLRRGYESDAVWTIVRDFINQSPEED